MRALAVLVVVTAVWGVTFVQVKDAVAVYPLFAFFAVRFALAVPLSKLALKRSGRGPRRRPPGLRSIVMTRPGSG